ARRGAVSRERARPLRPRRRRRHDRRRRHHPRRGARRNSGGEHGRCHARGEVLQLGFRRGIALARSLARSPRASRRPQTTKPTATHPTATQRGSSDMTERVVLAYSGGLDTSVAIPYLAERTGAEVIAVAVNVGQGGEDMEVIRKRALACGAVESEVIDAREEFAAEFCMAAVRANALYMDRYPLVSALSRPLIVTHLVEAAARHGGTIVSHGCTGKGNDQVRFEVGIGALAPSLKVIAPARDYAWTRDKAIAYAEDKRLPIETSKKSPYSIDQNVWG